MLKKSLILCLCILFLFSCEKDMIVENIESNTPITDVEIIDNTDLLFQENFGEIINTAFFGKVTNINGDAIENATVTINGNIVSTDLNGIFFLSSINVFENFAYITIKKDGFVDGLKTIVPNAESNFLAVQLIEKSITGTVSSGTTSNVAIDESNVTFSGDFIYTDGSSYSGDVDVMMHYLAPNKAETFATMPGMLLAQQDDNTAVGLETYGMLLVNLFASSGEQLNIASTSPAILNFPIDPSQVAFAPEQIDLWYFDETVGYWKQSGFAEKQGNIYVGQVTHFSWWNCDAPIDYSKACFTVYNGTTTTSPISNNYIEIYSEDTNTLIFSGYTNDKGQICGNFPASGSVVITVYGTQECGGQIIHQETSGPISNGDAFDIFATQTGLATSNLTAQLTDCNNMPITNGYVLIYNEGLPFSEATTQVQITNGQLDYNLNYCGEYFSIVLFDLNTNQASNAIAIDLEYQDPIIDLGAISSCNNSSSTYIGDLTFTTQDALDTFGAFGYVKVAGDLIVYGNAINNLQALSNITEITGEFIINNTNVNSLTSLNPNVIVGNRFYVNANSNLTSLDGIENFTFNGIVTIDGGALVSINALSTQTSFFTLELSDCSSLLNLNSLQNVTSIGRLIIDGCNSLQNLSGLEGLTTTGDIKVTFNNQLTTLSGLHNVTSSTKLTIGYNNSLTSLNGLDNLTTVSSGNSSGIQIINNPMLSSIFALNSLISIESFLQIRDNVNLESLTGLENLISIGTALEVEDNDALSDLCSLQNLLTNGALGGTYSVFGNVINPSQSDIINGNCN